VGIDTEKIDECFDMESVRQTVLSGPPLQADPPETVSRTMGEMRRDGGRRGGQADFVCADQRRS